MPPSAWMPQVLAVPLVLALCIAAVARQAGPSTLATPVVLGTTLGLCVSLAITSLTPAVVLPWPVLCSTAWLTALLAGAWRGGLTWHRAVQATQAGTLVPPRHHRPVIATLRRHQTLLRLLVARDLTLKYRGSLMGVLWSLANPLVMTVTYGLVFTYVYPSRTEGFVFLLLLGILAWTFFSVTARMATAAIVDSGSLVKNVYFPRLVLPSATVLFNLVQYVVAMLVLVPVLSVMTGRMPSPLMLLVPVPLALLVAFTWGLALMLAATTASLRDVQHLLDVTLQVLFWATPVVYTLDIIPAGPLQSLALLSPLAPFIVALRSLAFSGAMPPAIVGTIMVLYTTCAVAIGLGVFVRLEERFAESL